MSDQIHRDDDYLSCEHYLSATTDEQGIHRFFEQNKYYFSLNENGKVILRSEGYSSESGRETGIASVLKNMVSDDNYQTKMLPDGKWILCLKAGNNQEIGRSCPVNSEEEARAFLPSERAKSVEALKIASANESTNVDRISDKVADDYMICREYEEKIDSISTKYPDFISFKHENTEKYYFAWVNSKKEIVLRSEGYPTPSARDNGMDSVVKNREIKERFKVVESHGAYFLVLKAGNHQEIGRSCPKDSEAALWALIEPKLSDDKSNGNIEDDYMLCRNYEANIKSVSAKYDDFICFQHEPTNLHYFAWINKNGEIILRSEGYPTTTARDNGMESVRKNRENKDRFKVEEKHGAYFLVLKAGNHQEIGRSCPKDSEAALWALLAPLAGLSTAAFASVAATTGAAATVTASKETPQAEVVTPAASMAATPVVAEKSGFNWWWLLPLLLLAALFLLWRSCNDKTSEASDTSENAIQENTAEATDTVKTMTAEAETVVASSEATSAPSCDLNWILFDFDQFDLNSGAKSELDNMAKILKSNPDYNGFLKAYTDAKGSDEYNQKLSEKRALSAKNYLVKQGVNAARVATEASSKANPVAANTEDDSGRRYNRRVELYIRDKSGKEICNSIPPNVPSQLKAN